MIESPDHARATARRINNNDGHLGETGVLWVEGEKVGVEHLCKVRGETAVAEIGAEVLTPFRVSLDSEKPALVPHQSGQMGGLVARRRAGVDHVGTRSWRSDGSREAAGLILQDQSALQNERVQSQIGGGREHQ